MAIFTYLSFLIFLQTFAFTLVRTHNIEHQESQTIQNECVFNI